MAGGLLDGFVNHGIDLGRMIKTDGTDLFSTYANVTKDKLPQLTDSVVDAFGRVLDIFERPSNLRKPEFHTAAPLKPSRQVELADSQLDKDVEVRPAPKPRINEDVHVEYLSENTRAQYDATHLDAALGGAPRPEGVAAAPRATVERSVGKCVSASPCDTEARLCSECFLQLATVRCDTCAVHFCAVCAVQRHSEGINMTHKLVTSTSGKEARLTMSDALAGDLSYGEMVTGPSGSFVGNTAKDLTIQIRQGESPYPSYDGCAVHAGKPLRLACVQCHLLPVCEQCAKEAHHGSDHKIVEIETAVAEVKELLGECLGAVVRRHNDLSLVLPELQQLQHASNVGLKNGTRSVRCGVQRTLDALKLKRSLGMQEIQNMQQIGSSALNRMMHASGALNRYLKGCVSQLESINSMNNAGMALNMFVDLRANFEKLLFTDEEIPDLVLEIPHWQLHSGNLVNLLAEHETRINSGMAHIAALSSYLKGQVRDSVKSIEKASSGASAPSDSVSQQQAAARRTAERRTRPAGPALGVSGAQNTLDIVTHSELKGIFLRRDSHRCAWRQRAVYLCGRRLFVLDSDLHAEDAPVESSIDLSAVTVRTFDDEDALQVTKLQRMGHPNGFEITEHSGRAMRYWLFTCESKNTVMLWVTRLGHVIQQVQRESQAAALSKAEREAAGALPERETAAGASMQALHRATCEPKESGLVADPRGEHKTCDDAHDSEYIYDELNFRDVSESLKKFKNESKALYNKCFQGDREQEAGRWHIQSISNHAASIPHSDSIDQSSAGSSRTTESRFVRGESISAGRYAMPDVSLQRTSSRASQRSVFSDREVKLPEKLPRFKYSPEVKSPRSIHQIFQDLASRSRKDKDCDILDRH